MNDEQMKHMLQELSEFFHSAYGDRLKSVILYGSVARGTQTDESNIDIMVLVDGDDTVLRSYSDKLSDVSTGMSLKYCRVFSIIDVSYQEYEDWEHISPFYSNVSREGLYYMPLDIATLSKYRLDRAKEDLMSAKCYLREVE